MTARATLALGALLLAFGARADHFPTRQGTSGLLDVPDAQALGLGGASLGIELRLDQAPGKPRALGPSPLTMAFGLGGEVEVGLGLREGGQPGDPRPSPLLFSGALKVGLFQGKGPVPSLALQGAVDRINVLAQGALELIASTELGQRVRLAAAAGVEDKRGLGSFAVGPRASFAVALRGPGGAELLLEALGLQGGAQLGGALRVAVFPETGITLGVQWQPGDHGLRLSLGFGFSSAPPPRTRRFSEEEAAPVAKAVVAAMPGARVFHDPLPHLRLRINQERMRGEDGNRHLQYGPQGGDPPASAPTSPAPETKAKAAPKAKVEAAPIPPAPILPAPIPHAAVVPSRPVDATAPHQSMIFPSPRARRAKSGQSQSWPSLETSVTAMLTKGIRDCLSSRASPTPLSAMPLPVQVIVIASPGAGLRAALVEGFRPALQPLQLCVTRAAAAASPPSTAGIYSFWLDLPALERP